MNLQRIKQLAGIKLNESIQSIPSLNETPEFNDIDGDWDLNELVAAFRAGKITNQEYEQHLDKITRDSNPDEDYTDRMMRRGEQGDYSRELDPELDEKAQSAWSTYNKKHGTTDDGSMAMEGDEHMEEFNQPGVEEALAYFAELTAAFVEPEVALEKVIQKATDDGFGEDEIECIKDAIYQVHGDDSEIGDGMTGAEADADTLASAGWGTDEDYGDFGGAGEFDESFELGDNTLGELAWFIVDSTDRSEKICSGPYKSRQEASSDTGRLAWFTPTKHFIGYGCDDDGVFVDSELETELEEDIQNGYLDIHDAKGEDYFPTGADSPAIRATGAAGARQGDNPEQKRMQVAEVHQELVYGYRQFLKESSSK